MWKVTTTDKNGEDGIVDYFDDVYAITLVTVGIKHHLKGTMTLEYVED